MYLKNKTYRKDLRTTLNSTVDIQKLYGRRILITGATGLIGSFAADILLYANRMENAEMEIYLLARDEKRLRERFLSSLAEKRLHFIVQDVTKPLKLSESVDYIIHAAGDGFPAAFREHPVETMTPALFGTYNLLSYAKEHDIKKFLYISSGETYGKVLEEAALEIQAVKKYAFKETDCGIIDSIEVRSCYPMAKKCAETMCVSFADEYNVPVVIARPSHIYGACTSIHDNRATVQFLNDAAVGENIVLRSAGKQMRSYTYVADCVSGIFTVLINGKIGEAYNIANGDSRVTVSGFAHILAEKTGVECIMEASDEASQKELTPIEYAVLDSSKLEQLGWKGQYDIYKGITRMLDTIKNSDGGNENDKTMVD